ncbi:MULTISPECIES: TetR/AcrR family transcriptional regulator [unclassified Paenibacillus]|uniref:TetR/AcrR family transcriptional regulator n=1 Tax=unclassified Paenibacillus TaxID=185978 RepID=UPI0011A31C04|nr:TetR family transcriptional regulator [Paenibacillus sp. 32O-W]
MAPKKKFSRQDIIDAAFEIARDEGLDGITIRKVAQRLGSSIAPIYVNFSEVEELTEAVVQKALDVSRQLIMERQTELRFRDIGMASLQFAKEYSLLYRDLVMKNNSHMKYNDVAVREVVELMKTDPDLGGFSTEELKGILLKMQIFQTGLSVMVANGLLPADFDDDRIMEMLDSAAEDVITAARLRQQELP